jgi:hypothetical protein
MTACVTIVTYACNVKPSRHATVESPSAATMASPLGIGRWRQEANRDTCDDCAKNGEQRKFLH